MNMLLQASSLALPRNSTSVRTMPEKEPFPDAEPPMFVDAETPESNMNTRPTPPTFSIFGLGEASGLHESCPNSDPTYDETSSSSPADTIYVSNVEPKDSMLSCLASMCNDYNDIHIPLLTCDINQLPAPTTADIPTPPSTLVETRYKENDGVMRVKRKPVPCYGDLATLGGKPSTEQRLHPRRRASASRPRHRQLTPPCPKEGLDLSDFVLKKVLGSGGQGKVYLASFGADLVAIKAIKKWQVEKDSAELGLVLQEQRILRTLDSPFVLSLHSSFSDSSYFYLIADFQGGGDLHQALVGAGKFDEHTARFYSAEMALGIEYLHSNGIVHRDIKLMNVLIKNDGHIVIADMGLVLDTSSPTRNEGGNIAPLARCGTVPYMSPEVLDGGHYGKAVDLWALGVCTYVMLTGELPWHGVDDTETIAMILDEPLALTEGVHLSAEAQVLLTELLKKDQSERLHMSGIYIHPFFKDMDWTALEKLQIQPPFVPTDLRLALMKATLPAHERFTPGFTPTFFSDKYPEYTYDKTEPIVPMKIAQVNTPIATPAEFTSGGESHLAGNRPSKPHAPLPWSSTTSLVSKQTLPSPVKEANEEHLVSITLGASVPHQPVMVLRTIEHDEDKGWTQPRFLKWLLGLSRRVLGVVRSRC
ncbi:kinase-like domain-containing protein [Lyophyllum atratum]|nr:kinase-like domain-containing protein [Lyophyllum atratum]